jgi:hypothetical protein
MQHGYAKLAEGPDAFASILHAIGVEITTVRELLNLRLRKTTARKC